MRKPVCVYEGDICGLRLDGTPRIKRYRCRTCKRRVPWCFGAADQHPHDCDDCWAEKVN